MEAVRGLAANKSAANEAHPADRCSDPATSTIRTWRPDAGLHFAAPGARNTRQFSTTTPSSYPNVLFGGTAMPPPTPTEEPVRAQSPPKRLTKSSPSSEYEKMQQTIADSTSQLAKLQGEIQHHLNRIKSREDDIHRLQTEARELNLQLHTYKTRNDAVVKSMVEDQLRPRLREQQQKGIELERYQRKLDERAQQQLAQIATLQRRTETAQAAQEAARLAADELENARNEDVVWQQKEQALKDRYAAMERLLEDKYINDAKEVRSEYISRFTNAVLANALKIEEAKRGYATRMKKTATYVDFRDTIHAGVRRPVSLRAVARQIENKLRTISQSTELSEGVTAHLTVLAARMQQARDKLDTLISEDRSTSHLQRLMARRSIFPEADGLAAGTPLELWHAYEHGSAQLAVHHLERLSSSSQDPQYKLEAERLATMQVKGLLRLDKLLKVEHLARMLDLPLELQWLSAPLDPDVLLYRTARFMNNEKVRETQLQLRDSEELFALCERLHQLKARSVVLRRLLHLSNETEAADMRKRIDTQIRALTFSLSERIKLPPLSRSSRKTDSPTPLRRRERQALSAAKEVIPPTGKSSQSLKRANKLLQILAPSRSVSVMNTSQSSQPPTSTEPVLTPAAQPENAAEGSKAAAVKLSSKMTTRRVRTRRRSGVSATVTNVKDASVDASLKKTGKVRIVPTQGTLYRPSFSGPQQQRTFCTFARSLSEPDPTLTKADDEKDSAWETSSDDSSQRSPASDSDALVPEITEPASSTVDADEKSLFSLTGDVAEVAIEEDELPILRFQIPEGARAVASATDSVEEPQSRPANFSFRLYRDPDGQAVKLHYHKTIERAETAAATLLNEPVLGFDLEWEQYSKPGVHDNKRCVSVLQLANERGSHVFHLAMFKGSSTEELIPPSLLKILTSPECIKAGVNIAGDAKRLKTCFGLGMQGMIELSHLYRLVKYGVDEPEQVNKRFVPLATQVEHILSLPMDKGEVRTSSWSAKVGSEQLEYAATDAYAGFRLFYALEEHRHALRPRPPRPAYHELSLPIVLADGSVAQSRGRKQTTVAANVDPAADDEEDVFYDALEEQDDGDEGSEVKPTTAPVKASRRQEQPEIVLANEWIADWRATHKNGLTPAPLRAYHLWHVQGFDIVEIAAKLRQPPILATTVAGYVADAVLRGHLKYEHQRLRAALDILPRSIHGRYKALRAQLDTQEE